MRRRTVLTAPALIALAAACGKETPGGGAARRTAGGAAGDGGAEVLMARGVSRLAPPPDTPVAPTVQGVRKFGYDLLRSFSVRQENTVVSPLSIAYAFGMAVAGANGQTKQEIDGTFGFPAEGPHTTFNSLSRKVVTTEEAPPKAEPTRDSKNGMDEPPDPIVAIANALFVDKGFKVGDAFLRTLAEQYGAGARAVQFADTAAAKKVINDWVRAQTAERIKKLFDDLDPGTKVVLANAVYMKAEWATQFSKELTKPTTFSKAGGAVKVPMMQAEESFGYAAGEGFQAVSLPYAKNKLAMWILVPKAGDPLDLLAPTTLSEVGSSLKTDRVKVALPRWDFATDLDLVPTLKKLGIREAFGSGADFSGIAPGLVIDQAIHRANITVDEQGTEAAAVTGIAMAVGAPLPATKEVRANRPFAFAVVHSETHAPLFTGVVHNPTA